MTSLVMIFLWCSTLFGQELNLDEETKALCNQVMLNIFDDIYAAKDHYQELKDFDKDLLVKNRHDIYSLQYVYHAPFDRTAASVYEFGITILGLRDENIFSDKENVFSLGFPLLDLRFIGYQIKGLKQKQFDILGPVQTHGQLLWNQQQRNLPVRLILESVKESYQVGEEIDFIVTLKNLTKRNIKVKDLSEGTLYFLYNNAAWGAREVDPQNDAGIKQIILKPLESISKRFRGEGSNSPKEFEIYGSYGMTYKGVNPTSMLKIQVGESEP
ncbi:MAG TPA: hypothetical protein DD723_04325 [Candidatus Omnitrophica bacterium]|nr:MAG: hypothetical protein A2Z81_03825 [Omnitrophica WOR_2 bacterium GWA2_45_18]HBR14755.1 hypothetical protein [Candidatus Omnitrophota bacterium]